MHVLYNTLVFCVLERATGNSAEEVNIMTFSIIVTVYNIADKISRCLESLLNQTYSEFELLVVIDGSTDDSEVICRKYEKKDARVKILFKENGGVVSARNYGAELAQGDYIVNVDGDDYVEKDYLQVASAIIRDYSPDMISFGSVEESSRRNTYVDNLEEGIYKEEQLEIVKRSMIYDRACKGYCGGVLLWSIWTKIVKRQFFLKCCKNIPFKLKIGEDLLLNIVLMNEIHTLYVKHSAYYHYIVYPSSTMHKYNSNNCRYYLDVAEELRKIDYIQNEDVSVYLFQAYFSEVKKLAWACKDFFEFRINYNKLPEIIRLKDEAHQARIQNQNLEDRLKYILLNTSSIFWLYVACKLSGKKS